MQSSLYASYKTIENNKEKSIMIFEGKEVEVFEHEGQVLFNPKHVAECLDITDVKSSIRNFNEKQVVKLTNSKMHNMHFRKLHNTGENFLTESGVYKLIFKSRKESAERFQDWVTDEVLPAIRRTGGYIPISQEDDEKTIMAKALMISQRIIEEKDALLAQKEKQVQYLSYEVESKDRYLNQIAQSKNTILVRELAKVISKENFIIGERRLWDKLRAWGLILKGKTEPSQRAVERGLFEVSESISRGSRGTFTHRTTRVTGKGQDYIIKRLLEEMEEQICLKVLID